MMDYGKATLSLAFEIQLLERLPCVFYTTGDYSCCVDPHLNLESGHSRDQGICFLHAFVR